MLSGAWHHESVGSECRTIVFDQLQPYGYWQAFNGDVLKRKTRPNYALTFLATQKDARAWWQNNKEKSLRELQLLVVEWIIAEEAKSAANFSEKEHATLKKIRDRLANGNKAMKSGNFYMTDREAFIHQTPKSK
jgi:hypothetical protein